MERGMERGIERKSERNRMMKGKRGERVRKREKEC